MSGPTGICPDGCSISHMEHGTWGMTKEEASNAALSMCEETDPIVNCYLPMGFYPNYVSVY